MREHDTGLRPSPASNAGEPIYPSTLTPEMAGLVGSEMADGVSQCIDRLSQIDRLSHTVNPFLVRDRRGRVDFGTLGPEVEEVVKEHQHGLWEKNNFGVTPGKLTRHERIELAKVMTKLIGASGDRKTELEKRTQTSASTLARLDEDMDTGLEIPGGYGSRLDLAEVQSYIDTEREAASQLPSDASIAGLKIIISAAMAPNEYVSRAFKPFSLWLRNGFSAGLKSKATAWQTGNEIVTNALHSNLQIGGLERTVKDVRDQGSEQHHRIVSALRVEQVRESVRLLEAIERAQAQLPDLEHLDGGQLDTALAAELYLAGRAREAASTIRTLDPRVSSDGTVKELAHTAQTLKLANALFAQQVVNKQTELRLIGPSAPEVSEARDILLGGRRLDPAPGQTEEYVHKVADELGEMSIDGNGRQPLSQQQRGLIMAMITGKLGNFLEVSNQARSMSDDEVSTIASTNRASAIKELRELDLEESLVKVRAFLSRPHNRYGLAAILGDPDSSLRSVRTMRKVVRNALRQLETAS